MARVNLNDWELLAIEAGLRLLKDTTNAHYTSIERLLDKLSHTPCPRIGTYSHPNCSEVK